MDSYGIKSILLGGHLATLLSLVYTSAARSDDDVLAQKTAYFGGGVSRDPNAPGRPIVGISFLFADDMDERLKDLAPHCRKPVTCGLLGKGV